MEPKKHTSVFSHYYALRAATLFCFADICWNFGVIKILSTKVLVTVAFVVRSFMYSGSEGDVRICGRNAVQWLAG